MPASVAAAHFREPRTGVPVDMDRYQGNILHPLPWHGYVAGYRAVYYTPQAEHRFPSCSSPVLRGTTGTGLPPLIRTRDHPRPPVIRHVHQNQLSLPSSDAQSRPQCSVCNHTFSKIGALKVHMRIHTGEKPFKCPYCPKAFAQSGNLKSHVRIHTGEKPYKCKYCGKRFTQSSALKNHVLTHFRKMESIAEALQEATLMSSPC